MDSQPGAVVVGVDGSPEARVAARLGALEALHRGAPLDLVLVLPWHEPSRGRAAGTVDLSAMVHSAAGLVLEATAAHVAPFAPGVPLTTRVLSGDPAEVLVTASASAAMVCVGSRNSSTLSGLLLGSVASAVVRSALCPVLVVPLRHVASVHGRRSVVVGLDCAPGSDAVAREAVTAAAARDTDLLAVHTWHHPYPGPAHVVLDPLIDPVSAQQREEELLEETLEASAAGASTVPVRRVVERARAADALVAASLTAELLVVGHRHRAPRPLGWLGSTTTAALHRAACPVLVVPLGGSRDPAHGPDRAAVTSATARP